MNETPRYAALAHHNAVSGFTEQYMNENEKNQTQVKKPSTTKDMLREVIRSRNTTIDNNRGIRTQTAKVGTA
ncbi:MAG: hypothetical protein AB1499_14275 [Nitrospirota bacterium]